MRSSRSAVSRSSRWRLHLLDVLDGLGVLLLGKRVDRAELLAPARQALDARAQRRRLLLAERLRNRLAVLVG